MRLCVASGQIFKRFVTVYSVPLYMCLSYNEKRPKNCAATFIALFVVTL